MSEITPALNRFRQLVAAPPAGYRLEQPVEDAFVWHPQESQPVAGREIGLMLMGITHGNEWAGVGVLSRVLEHIHAGLIDLPGSVAFVLGNVPAAEQNRRFTESDLNRSFAVADPSTREQLRAAALMPLIKRCAFLVDFHQTLRKSAHPFFIFPHTRPSYDWARELSAAMPIVTHWGQPFSKAGQCTDEYLNAHGGTGITIELGQNGLDPYQIAIGVDIALAAIGTTWRRRQKSNLQPIEPGPIYTWEHIVPWPEQGIVELNPGFNNFSVVENGQQVGTVDGAPLRVDASGPILFPKYLTPDEQRQLPAKPAELMRILKKVAPSELPG